MINFLNSINQYIDSDLKISIPNESIREPILYAMEGGKRWRPIIFMSLFETSSVSIEKYPCLRKLYLFIEYIHNASLMIDDMPMMDNDDYRRDGLTVHKKYNEATCKLCSLQLLILAQKHYTDCMIELKQTDFFDNEEQFIQIYFFLNNKIYDYLGSVGLCYGQYMDLHLKKENSASMYTDMINYKTSSLFVLSFLLGYVLSRKSIVEFSTVQEIGKQFGMIYQILDDLEDYESDIVKHNNNILQFYPKPEIINIIKQNYRSMVDNLNELQIGCTLIQTILSKLKEKWLKTKIILYSKLK
jgi:geranylgeranyl diphosphate synthase type II